MARFSRALCVACLLLTAPVAGAQFDPAAGEWGKDDPADIRVMTWNVRDAICRTANKANEDNNWAAVARIIAAMQPDILLLQETGDNSGNGTGGSGDSQAQLLTTVQLLFEGGSDPFNGGQTVTQYVQAFAPGYTLPHIYASESSDGFNRNVIVSRWPFVDLNGDGKATVPSFTTAFGTSGIRGIQVAEINLPSETYAGDLVVSNAHLKAFNDSDSRQQRVEAAEALATYIWNLYEGAGTGTVDPNSLVSDFPPASAVLGPNTAIVWGGDYNEDEATNGRDGPVQISIQNMNAGGTSDGTDKDGTDAAADTATEPFSGSRSTQSSSKLDWLMWQDSVATPRNQFIFNSTQVPSALVPPELLGFGVFPPFDGRTASTSASDHRPVIVDLIVPLGESPDLPQPFALLAPADGATGVSDSFVSLQWQASTNATAYDLIIANDPGLTDVVIEQLNLPSPSAFFVLGEPCSTYYWSVTANNFAGSRVSTPAVASFSTVNPADQNGDGLVDPSDFTAWVTNYNAGSLVADVNGDGLVDPSDFTAWVVAYNGDC
ncbi:MAG: GC-type dockerin domain-anchored protein [Phycisphaerales bacterium]